MRVKKKAEEDEGDVCWCLEDCPKKSGKVTGEIRDQRDKGNHPPPHHFQNQPEYFDESGEMRRLTVTQTPVRYSQLKMV